MEEIRSEREKNDEIEIDLGRLFKEIKKKIKFIIAVSVLGAIIAFCATEILMTKKYESTAKIYLKPNITESGMIDYNTINANSKMVNNYVLMLQGDTLLTEVTKTLGLKDINLVEKAITVKSESDSEIIEVTAKTKDPVLSRDIVKTTVSQFFETMKDQLDIKNMTILDQPKVNENPVSPSLKLNLVIGAVCGLFISGIIVIMEFILDKRLHSKDDVEVYLGIPVLAEIPYYED